MLTGDQAGKRVSRRACYAIHRALRTAASFGYDVHDIKPHGQVYQTRIYAGVRAHLREYEDEYTNAAEYATIILHRQRKTIRERGEGEELARWANYLLKTGKIREQYHWLLIRDILPWPNHQRGPKHNG